MGVSDSPASDKVWNVGKEVIVVRKEKHKNISVSAKSNLQKLDKLHFFLSQIKSSCTGIWFPLWIRKPSKSMQQWGCWVYPHPFLERQIEQLRQTSPLTDIFAQSLLFAVAVSLRYHKERARLYSVSYRDASSNLGLYLIVILYLACSNYLVSGVKKIQTSISVA